MNEQAREELKKKLRDKFEAEIDAIADEAERFRSDPCAATLYSLEKNVNARLDRIGDAIGADLFVEAHESPELQDESVEASKKNAACTTGDGTRPSSSSTEGQ